MNLTIHYVRELLAALGADVSTMRGCRMRWSDLAAHYADYRERVEDVIERATTGDPAGAAYMMWCYYDSSREWAERVIERAATGDPARAAYRMRRDCGSSQEWAEGVIERATTGDPGLAAYMLYLDCGSSHEWAESVRLRINRERSVWYRWVRRVKKIIGVLDKNEKS